MTQEVEGEIIEIRERIDANSLERKRGVNTLEECEIGKISVKLKKPMVFEKFGNVAELGRFVIKEGGEIIAGGIIT
jgi:sulfate adenylyltransferase subunit 1 (EFTu-like GTPase family)